MTSKLSDARLMSLDALNFVHHHIFSDLNMCSGWNWNKLQQFRVGVSSSRLDKSVVRDNIEFDPNNIKVSLYLISDFLTCIRPYHLAFHTSPSQNKIPFYNDNIQKRLMCQSFLGKSLFLRPTQSSPSKTFIS